MPARVPSGRSGGRLRLFRARATGSWARSLRQRRSREVCSSWSRSGAAVPSPPEEAPH